jgi:hypothetical protein
MGNLSVKAQTPLSDPATVSLVDTSLLVTTFPSDERVTRLNSVGMGSTKETQQRPEFWGNCGFLSNIGEFLF